MRDQGKMQEPSNLTWAALADKLGQTGTDILTSLSVTVGEKPYGDPTVVAIMMMARTLSNFRGVVALMECGLVLEARILARSCLENAFWIAALNALGSKFVTAMFQDEMRSMSARGEQVLSKNKLPLDSVERLRRKLRKISKRPRSSKTSLTPKEVALSGALSERYPFYNQLSADSSHPTVTSLRRYVGPRESGDQASVTIAPVPADDEVRTTWHWACDAMLAACVGVNEILGGTEAGQKLGQIALQYDSLALSTPPKPLHPAPHSCCNPA